MLKMILTVAGSIVSFFARDAAAELYGYQGLKVAPTNFGYADHPHNAQQFFGASTIRQHYSTMAEQLCFTSHSLSNCLKSALENVKDCGTSSMTSQEKRQNAINALQKFVDDPSVQYSHSYSHQQATIALAGLYWQHGEYSKTSTTLHDALLASYPEKPHSERDLGLLYYYTQAASGQLNIAAHIENALNSYDANNLHATKKTIKHASKENVASAKLLTAADLWRKGKTTTAEKYIDRTLNLHPDYQKYIRDLKDTSIDYQTFKEKFLAADNSTPNRQSPRPR